MSAARGLPLVLALACCVAGLLPASAQAAPRAGWQCAIPNKDVPGTGAVRRVPEHYATIQAAVDRAKDGDTILVGPGTYSGGIRVTKPGLRIRGTDRDQVIIDGRGEHNGGERAGFGIEVMADRVMVENMTLRTFTYEAIAWRPRIADDGTMTRPRGFWGRYLTVTGAGHTPLLVAGARCGQLDHIVATGSPIGGITFQGCDPCDAIVTESVMKHNSLGFNAIDAFRGLHVGALDGKDDSEADDNLLTQNQVGLSLAVEDPVHWVPPPEVLRPHSGRGAIVRDNVVRDNRLQEWPGPCEGDDEMSRACESLGEAYNGTGVFLFGSRAALVERNVIEDNPRLGVQLAGTWHPSTGNVIRHNLVRRNSWFNEAAGVRTGADLFQDTIVGPGNCWEGNHAGDDELRVEPPRLQDVWRCDLPTTPAGGGPTARARCAVWGPPALPGRTSQPTCWRPTPGDRTTTGRKHWSLYDPPTDTAAVQDAPADPGPVDEWLPELRKVMTP